MRWLQKFGRDAQTLLEYTILIGIVALTIAAITPTLRRGVQSVLKVTADQIAPQNQSEQAIDPESGYLVNLSSTTKSLTRKRTREMGSYTSAYEIRDIAETQSNSLTNLGTQQAGY